jgi:hypothetical protein
MGDKKDMNDDQEGTKDSGGDGKGEAANIEGIDDGVRDDDRGASEAEDGDAES